MKVLYLAGSNWHSHDYGNAFLFDGLIEVLSYSNVIDWPENPTFHLRDATERDACGLDSDLFYPEREVRATTTAAFQGTNAATLIVLAVADRNGNAACKAMPHVPVVAVDYSDQVVSRRAEYEACAGRPLAAYFKRELSLVPPVSDDAYSLPLCYPASRVPKQFPDKTHTIVYHATNHRAAGPGLPRMHIVDKLCELLEPEQLDVGLYVGQEKGTRPTPEELHDKMARGLIGISWNGWPHVAQWDSNRFHENFAFGLAQVAERPRIQLPELPVDGRDCLFADTPDQVVKLVVDLARDEARARTIAAAGHAWFMKHDTSRARAMYLLAKCGFTT